MRFRLRDRLLASAAISTGDFAMAASQLHSLDPHARRLARAGAGASNEIFGYAIGDVGTGLYDGLMLTDGLDFSQALPSRWHPSDNPDGAWSSGPLHTTSRTTSRSTDWSMVIDPYWRGGRSESPTALGLDGITLTSGGANFVLREPDASATAYLPSGWTVGNSGKPRLFAGGIYSGPGYAISAASPFIVENIFQGPAGEAAGLWLASLWTSGQFWPDEGELDLVEIFKRDPSDTTSGATTQSFAFANVITNGSDGGGSGSVQLYNADLSDTRTYWFAMKRTATSVELWDDVASEGTLVLRGSTTTNNARIRGAHDIRIAAVAAPDTPGTGTVTRTFDATDWPKNMKMVMYRAWTPAAAGLNLPTVDLGVVTVTPGQSGATYTFPAAATMWAGGPLPNSEQVIGGFYNLDSPGGPTRISSTKLPGGSSYNAGTRTITWNVPTTEGGSTCFYMYGIFSAGGPVRRARVTFRVAPAIQGTFPTTIPVNAGASLNQTVAYTDFHSGDLTHTYTSVSADQGWVTVTMGAGNRSFTLTGTAPGTDQTVTVSGNATNGVGQTTSFNITINVSTVWSPSAWANLLRDIDFTDTTQVFTDTAGTSAASPTAGTAQIARVNDKKATSAPLLNGGTTSTRPTYQNVSTPAGNVPMARFTRASNQHIDVTDTTTLNTQFGGVNKPYTLVMAVKRGTPSVSVRPVSMANSSGGTLIQHFLSSSDKVGVQRNDGSVKTAQTTTSDANADEIHVWTEIYDGTNITFRKDGTQIGSPIAMTTTASISIANLTLGGNRITNTSTWDSTVAFDGCIGRVFLSSDSSATTDVVNAENLLKTQFGL